MRDTLLGILSLLLLIGVWLLAGVYLQLERVYKVLNGGCGG